LNKDGNLSGGTWPFLAKLALGFQAAYV